MHINNLFNTHTAPPHDTRDLQPLGGALAYHHHHPLLEEEEEEEAKSDEGGRGKEK